MPLLFQKIITKDDLLLNPKVLYLFGDNAERIGKGGQAAVMRGEHNAAGIRTKWKPGRARTDYYQDGPGHELNADLARMFVDEDFHKVHVHAREGGLVICPADGLGTGLAELPTRAPSVMAHIRAHLRRIATHDYSSE